MPFLLFSHLVSIMSCVWGKGGKEGRGGDVFVCSAQCVTLEFVRIRICVTCVYVRQFAWCVPVSD